MRSSARSGAIPPCSRCRHRASPEGAVVRGSMARASDADAVAALPASVHAIAGYGGRSARLRHAVCRPRFLKGVIVRWCELAKGSGWTKVRLLLSTDPTLSAPAIVEAYSKRWSIEPLFRDLKMIDGLGAMWQR